MKRLLGKTTQIILALFVLVLPFAFVLGWLNQYTPRWVYAVKVEGSLIGYVDQVDNYAQIVQGVLSAAEKEWNCHLVISERVELERKRQWHPRTSSSLVEARANTMFTFMRSGWAIYVNGQQHVVLDSEALAQQVLEDLKQHYVSNRSNRQLLSVAIVDDVSIRKVAVEPSDVSEADAALQQLLGGGSQQRVHTVRRGETLSAIARSYDLSIAELRDVNPDLTDDLIVPGQQLNLVLSTPSVRVKTVEELFVTERIPPPIRYVRTGSLWYYQSQVQESGSSGSREVVYRVESLNGIEQSRSRLSVTVTREPTTRVIAVGTSRWPSAATGMFDWPLRSGRITDRFGTWRRHGPHQGVDIGASAGEPIRAARGGVVIRAEYHRSYGWYVVIDHQNGYGTLYAHARSRPSVSVGQSVSRGQVIAQVGRSGEATGNHLHFEIFRIVNNRWERLNPLRFYAP